jgi:hypothetical protein
MRAVVDDSQGQRTMFIGILIGFAVYALSFVMPYLIEGSTGQWISLGLIAVSMVFTLGWFFATRRGFRVSKGPNRVERKLKETRADEREKLRKARMRR